MGKMVEFLKLPAKIWVVIVIAGTSILLTQPIAERYYRGEALYHKYGLWVFFVTVLAWSFLIVDIFLYFWNRQAARNAIKHRIQYVNSLTEDKMLIIRKLYNKPDHVIELRMQAEQVKELETNAVIGKAATQKVLYIWDDPNDPTFPYILQPWVISNINNGKISIDEPITATKVISGPVNRD